MRAKQTADAMQSSMQTCLPLQALAMFNEIDYGPDENQPEAAVIARLGQDALFAWDHHAKVPSGWKVDPAVLIAHWQQFAAIVVRDHAGKTVLVISSNGIIRFSPHLTGDFTGF